MKAKLPLSLTGAQRRALRALGHHLRPAIQIGLKGVTEGVIQATEEALEIHELIKISTSPDAPESRKETPGLLADATGSHVVQIIGRTGLLYRRREEEPEIELPGVVDLGSVETEE